MPDYHVTRINKPYHFSRHEQITHIGALSWRMKVEEVIALIDSGKGRFYVDDPKTRKQAELVVVRNDGLKPPYVQASIAGQKNDLLLDLEECRISATACLLGVCRCC